MKIGDWIRREGRPIWHLVESVIADDAVAACGRRMPNEDNSRGGIVIFVTNRVAGTQAGYRCLQCFR